MRTGTYNNPFMSTRPKASRREDILGGVARYKAMEASKSNNST